MQKTVSIQKEGTDYVTKWMEAKALARATEQSVVNFLFEEIFVRFGVPRETVTDQGTQFTSKMVQDIASKYQIKHRKSTPYHPQVNEQVESTNKTLEAIMTKKVQAHRKTGQKSFKKLYGHTESPIRIALDSLLINWYMVSKPYYL